MNTVHITRLYSTGIAIVFCALICVLTEGCTRQPLPVGPKFSGRLLLLAGENTNGADLFELIPASTGSTYNYSVVTTGVFEAAASPDRTRLLYTTKDGIFLRDLRNGAVKQLAPGAEGGNYCLAWSPDGNRFSFDSDESHKKSARTKLNVSDLDGKTKLIWESYVGGKSSSCGHWIAPDRFIFDRLLGVSPQQERAGEVLLPNTTTLAILGDNVKFVDTERKWSIDGVCQVGSAAVVRPKDQVQPLLIAKNLDNLKTLSPSPISCNGCRFVGFAAQSCVPFFIETGSTSSELFYLNPTNLQRQRGAHIDQTFSVNAKMLIKSSARLMIVGDAPASLLLIDTESGETVPFFPKSGQPAASDGVLPLPRPIVWIEN